MRTTGDAATSTFGMTKFKKVRQLIAVPGIYCDLQSIGGFLCILHSPALGIGASPLRSGGLNLISDSVSDLFDCDLYALIGQCSIFIQLLHHGSSETIDKKHPKYTGFLALYYHYLYILGKIEKRQYPPRVTGKIRQEVMRFEQLREQFQFLNEHGISTEADMTAFVEKAEAQIKTLTKQRTILNVQKKKRQLLFQALTDEEALAPAKRLYDQGHSGMEVEAQQYMDAVKLLDSCGESREALSQQQAELYTKLVDLNREIRQVRKQLKMCSEIQSRTAEMKENIREIEAPEHQRQSRHRDRT